MPRRTAHILEEEVANRGVISKVVCRLCLKLTAKEHNEHKRESSSLGRRGGTFEVSADYLPSKQQILNEHAYVSIIQIYVSKTNFILLLGLFKLEFRYITVLSLFYIATARIWSRIVTLLILRVLILLKN